jgi:hypothetical protein
MAGANRFMNPQKAEHRQTYVSQFVPYPFQIMQRKAENEQRKFDSVKDNWKIMNEAMGERLLKPDMPMEDVAVQNLRGRIDDALEQYQGDWRQLESVVRNVGNEYKRYMTTQEGAIGRMSKKAFDEGAERVNKSEMPSQEKELFNRASLDRYAGLGGAKGGNVLEHFEPYNVKDWQNKALKHVSALNAMQQSKATAGFDESGRLIIDGYDDLKSVDASRIKNAVRTAVSGDQDFNDMVNKKYKIGKMYGMIDPEMNRAEYKEALFNDMLGDFSEHEYTQHTQRRGIKESSFGRGMTKDIIGRGGIISNNSRHYYRKDDFKDVLNKDNDELLESFIATNDAKMAPFDKAMETMFFQENAGLTKNDFDNALNGIAKENGLDLNIMSDKRKFMQKVADGNIDLSKTKAGGVIATETNIPKLQQQAKTILKDMRNDSRILDGVAEELSTQGIISKDDYNKYNDFIENSLEDRRSLLNDIKSKSLPEQARRKAEADLDILDRAIWHIEDLMYGTKTERDKLINKNYLENAGYSFLANISEALDSDNGRNMLRSRLQNASENYVNTQFLNIVPIQKGDGTVDRSKGMQLASRYDTAIKNNFSNLLNVPVSKQGNVTDVTLKGAVADKVENDISREINTDGTRNPDYGREFQDVYEERIKNLKNSQILFGDRFNPEDNSQMIKLGEYEIDLGSAPQQFDFPDLKYEIDPEFTALKRAKTDITKAIKSGRSNTEIEDGILIHIPQPDQADKIGKDYEQVFEDGTRYAVRISNSAYGIPSRSDYTMVPQENVIPFMKVLKNVQAKTEQTGTWYNPNTNKTLTREDLIKQLITRYTKNE